MISWMTPDWFGSSAAGHPNDRDRVGDGHRGERLVLDDGLVE